MRNLSEQGELAHSAMLATGSRDRKRGNAPAGIRTRVNGFLCGEPHESPLSLTGLDDRSVVRRTGLPFLKVWLSSGTFKDQSCLVRSMNTTYLETEIRFPRPLSLKEVRDAFDATSRGYHVEREWLMVEKPRLEDKAYGMLARDMQLKGRVCAEVGIAQVPFTVIEDLRESDDTRYVSLETRANEFDPHLSSTPKRRELFEQFRTDLTAYFATVLAPEQP